MDLREQGTGKGRRHPWERARLGFVTRLLVRHCILPTTISVLDVGAGDGWLATHLAKDFGNTAFTCFDSFYTASDIQKLDGAMANLTAVSDITNLDGHQFGLITALDVMEHVDDDHGFLRGLVAEQLSPGGYVLITVPAWQRLWATHDQRLDHKRRYHPRQLAALISACGLESLSQGGFFHSLIAPRALTVVRERLFGRSQAQSVEVASWSHGRWLTAAVVAALRLDNELSSALARVNISLPGLSLWALCRATC